MPESADRGVAVMRGWRRPARERDLWAHGDKGGYLDGRGRRDRLCLSR